MWHKKKIIIIALVAVLVLIAGSIGGVALAQTTTPNSDNTTPANTLMSRVAGILGIDQQTLENAFTQAQKEMRTEAQEKYLQGLVDRGKITQEQKDQYKTWMDAKPDITIKPGLRGPGFPGGFMPRGFMGGFGMHGGRAPQQPAPGAATTSY